MSETHQATGEAILHPYSKETIRICQAPRTVSVSSDDHASVRFFLGPTTPCWLPISLPVQQAPRTGGKVSAYRSSCIFKPVFWAQKRILGQKVPGLYESA